MIFVNLKLVKRKIKIARMYSCYQEYSLENLESLVPSRKNNLSTIISGIVSRMCRF